MTKPQSRGTLSQVKARQLVKQIQSDEPINQSNAPTFQEAVAELAKLTGLPNEIVAKNYPQVKETAISSWGPIVKKIFPDQPTNAEWLDRLNALPDTQRLQFLETGEPEDCDHCNLHQCQPDCIESVRKIRVSSP